MKPPSCFCWLITFLFISSYSIYSQVFNIEDYKQFLQQHQNMSTEQLLQMHDAGTFTDQINTNYSDALYFDSLDGYYNFSEFEKSLIQDHGFMVSERLKRISFGESLLEIFNQDFPVFVSTDAILHAFHISYDRILTDMEVGLLEDRLTELLWNLRNSMNQLHNNYGSNPEMITMLKDVDVYVTVPLLLLEENVQPYYPENNVMIDSILNWIDNEQGGISSTIFSSTCRVMDWSQFKPRGHYVYNPSTQINLEGYFRAMMWLGRIELYLIAPSSHPVQCSNQKFQDIQRQAIDAFLIDELFDIANAKPIYEEMENILKFFVGESDNVTLDNLDYLKQAISLNSPTELLDSLKMVEFQDTLKNQAFAYQLILSQILFSNPMIPDTILPASAFMMFGQRFVIDSYVTGSVVYDRIKYFGVKICRLFPSTLDVLFSIGNSASAQLLIDELNVFHYSTNLAALRYLIDHYDQNFWESSIYNYWLNSIRKLNPPEDRSTFPEFMKTAAFWQQKMNTQLASWTELRHDNLLYAKQSYTGGTVCSYPYSFVEPFPEFYSTLNDYSNEALNYFTSLNFPDPAIKNKIIYYFGRCKGITDTLKIICEKELAGIPFNSGEQAFLAGMIYQTGQSGVSLDGWYPNLFYDDVFRGEWGYEGLMESDHIVADIHTTPTNCSGGSIGAISHVGTGNINLGVFITENHLGELTAFVGPVMSYYEYRTTNFLRLTDDEWENTYLQSALRPEWVNIYLADSLGQSRGSGTTLITSVEQDINPIIPQSQILLNNYPNPFNPYTIISFSIPYDLTNSFVELKIYDINGSLVKTLVNENLPAGNYLTKWEGDNISGTKVSSGIYIYSIRVGDRAVNNKMSLIK
ncbi:MAG: DUF3160 domain-containing protein [Ignavibacteriota bacterium]|nr:DUF3160 domain-containing protein [Ignavibacteriota bacterium]QKJ99131.1 MAG: DUF3160 domain-containing protein [Ignavibacteriota bacterium]